MKREKLEKEIEKIFFNEIHEAVGRIMDRLEKTYTATDEVVELFLKTYKKILK